MHGHYRNETHLLTEITGVARIAGSLEEALRRMEALLAGEIGAATLSVRNGASAAPLLASGTLSRFFESKEFPFRGIYTAPLAEGGRPAVTLVAVFGAWGAPGDFLRRATAHAAAQLARFVPRTGEVA